MLEYLVALLILSPINYLTSFNTEEQLHADNYVNSDKKAEQPCVYYYVSPFNTEEQLHADNYVTSGKKEEQLCIYNYVTSFNIEEPFHADSVVVEKENIINKDGLNNNIEKPNPEDDYWHFM